jgi:preprotein translocase subunit SecE
MADESISSKSFWQQTRDYFGEVRAEMHRVTWPGRQEIWSTTVMVIITTFAFAAYFAACDSIFSKAVSWFLAWFSHRA